MGIFFLPLQMKMFDMRVQHWLTHLFVFMRFQQYFCCKADGCLSPIRLWNLLVVSLKVTSYYFNTWCWNVQQMIYCCSDWYLKCFHLKGNRSHFWLNVSCDLNFTVFFFSALYFFPVFTLYHVLSPVLRPLIILLYLVWWIRAASLNRTELTVEVICLREEELHWCGGKSWSVLLPSTPVSPQSCSDVSIPRLWKQTLQCV